MNAGPLHEIRARLDWNAPEYGLTEADVRWLLSRTERVLAAAIDAAVADAEAGESEARFAALRQDLEALADEWEPGVWAIGNGYAARSLRAILAEHATKQVSR